MMNPRIGSSLIRCYSPPLAWGFQSSDENEGEGGFNYHNVFRIDDARLNTQSRFDGLVPAVSCYVSDELCVCNCLRGVRMRCAGLVPVVEVKHVAEIVPGVRFNGV
ncbi:hypothetical protein L1987_46112 [Smallanthus sonchifolius]|uniref:Uncharacterized protein n=1 Tax=Smallanthus sonchifolius TaxID=185202 RepID=A0ACB9FZV7_9ASTR|nr:hypothetical protein L1987_46112 [Smallanthus sonchifolius]